MTSGYGPTGTPAPAPDPNYNNYNSHNNTNSRDLNSRMNELEHQLRVLDHRQKEDEQFLNRQYQDKYAPRPYSSGTTPGTYNNDRSETVPQRHRRDEFNSSNPNSIDDQNYPPPNKRRTVDPIDQENRKPVLSAPTPNDQDLNPKPKEKESEPQAFKLDFHMTSAAVAPRERMEIVTKDSKVKSIAKSTKKTIKTSENHPSIDLARQ